MEESQVLSILEINGSFFSQNKTIVLVTNRNDSSLVIISSCFGLLSAYLGSCFYSGSYISPRKFAQTKEHRIFGEFVFSFFGKNWVLSLRAMVLIKKSVYRSVVNSLFHTDLDTMFYYNVNIIYISQLFRYIF